jgi:L-ribulose-5-phosphate 4-epimerase
MESIQETIQSGKTVLGLEFGSTRIKACLIDKHATPLASGSFAWENQLDQGIWSYSLKQIVEGLQACYASLSADIRKKYGIFLEKTKAIGLSGMMHGYMPFDQEGQLLVPFRTWRNTITAPAAEELSQLFQFNIPQRWSIAHFYQAILNGEKHVSQVSYLTTLAVYVQSLLAGVRAVGIGEASGMFPIGPDGEGYDVNKERLFDELAKSHGFTKPIATLLPKIVKAGQSAGVLTQEGADLLDPSGHLQASIPFCPPEGDAETGMAATNALAPLTGNVSAGTSVFAMVVLDKPLNKLHQEIDIVTTPEGRETAMVHANNCCGELDHWVSLFDQVLKANGANVDKNTLYQNLYETSLKADENVGGLEASNYLSGEAITGIPDGQALFMHHFSDSMTLPNFMRAQLYTSLATLRLGMDILKDEGITATQMAGQGGFFTVKSVGPAVMAAALRSNITLLKTAGEGGPWGMALLASYLPWKKKDEGLEDYLNRAVFAHAPAESFSPGNQAGSFDTFMANYPHTLAVERTAVAKEKADSSLDDLKRRVCQANLDLVRNGLVILTWGNVSAIDRKKGLVVIKPSGVDYQKMRWQDMVVVDLDGTVIEGTLNPSSDTPTHLALYKAFPTLGGICHTHSFNAVAFAQAGRPITAYGTTHADAFYGDVPVTRSLSKAEIEQDYELNTGKVIIETFQGKDPLAIPAVLVKNHGPFTWGTSPEKAVENAQILEADAKMAIATEILNPSVKRVDQNLLDKHYHRKHGKNAYYGQANPKG